MTRTESTNPAFEPDERRAATAVALVRDLLACGFGERILLLTGNGACEALERGLDRRLEDRMAARKGFLRTVGLPSDPTVAERELASILAQEVPDGIVNRSPHAIASWPAVRNALAGGSRLLELPGLDDDALVHCLAEVDLGSLRWTALELARRVERGSTLAVRDGNRETPFPLANARAADFLAPPLMRGAVASLPGAIAIAGLPGGSTLLVGLHPTARPDGGPIERSRSLGAVSVLGPDGQPAGDRDRTATVVVDGVGILHGGTIVASDADPKPKAPRNRRGRLRGTIDAARRVLSGMPFRTFFADGGRISIAGPLIAQAAWLRGLTGRSVGRIERSDSFRVGGLRRRLRPDDVVIAALGGPRSRLERIGGREAGWFEVPTYPRMVVPLGPLREKGLEAFTAASESAKEPLRYIRTKRLGWRTVAADPESVRRFETRYHVPTMVDRHGPEAAIRPPAGLIEECGRAELLEIIHEGQAVGMSLFRPTSPRAELLQIGVLDGDERWLKMRILSLCYALPGLQCAQRAIDSYDLGRSPPFPWHPVLNFKSKWGAAVDPGPATERLLVRLPAASPATWHLLSRSGLVAVRRDGQAVAIVAVDGSSDLERVREVALPGLAEIVVVHEGIDPPTVTAALEGVRNPRPVRFVPRADLDRLAAIVG
jgi:hypothetical protein